MNRIVNNLSYCEYPKVLITAREGSDIGNCFKEMLLIAVTEWRNVELIFNGQKYLLNINSLMEQIKKRTQAKG